MYALCTYMWYMTYITVHIHTYILPVSFYLMLHVCNTVLLDKTTPVTPGFTRYNTLFNF